MEEYKRTFIDRLLNRNKVDTRPKITIDQTGDLLSDKVFAHTNVMPLVEQVSYNKFWNSAGTAALAKVMSGLDKTYLELKNATSESYALFSYIDATFDTVDALCQLDSSVQQMVERLASLVLKEGYRVYGKNQIAVDYINARIHHFPALSNSFDLGVAYTFKLFLYAAVTSLIKYANVFIYYNSFKEGTKIGKRTLNAAEPRKQPIAIPIVVPPIQKTTSTGKDEYEPMNSSLNFKLEASRVIHYAPKTTIIGDTYGFPNLMSVYYDILNLRGVEQAVLALIQRSLYPIVHVTVKEGDVYVPEALSRRIERLDTQLKAKSPEDALVTEDTVDIKVIGSESFALRASPYLDYIFTRTIAGMHGSRAQFGYGGADASEIDASSFANVEQLQRLIEDLVVYFFFVPVLLEANFDPLNNVDDCVFFELISPDINKRMRIENNQIQKWINSLVGQNEARHSVGHDEYNVNLHGPLYVDIAGTSQDSGSTAPSSNQYTQNAANKKNVSNPPLSAEIKSIVGEIVNLSKKDFIKSSNHWMDAIYAALISSGFDRFNARDKTNQIIEYVTTADPVPSMVTILEMMV